MKKDKDKSKTTSESTLANIAALKEENAALAYEARNSSAELSLLNALAATHVTQSVTSNLESTLGTAIPNPYYSSRLGHKMYDDVYIEHMPVSVTMRTISDIHSKMFGTVVKTNLDRIRTLKSEELAEFIIKEAKRYVSGAGNPVEELTEWLNSDV